MSICFIKMSSDTAHARVQQGIPIAYVWKTIIQISKNVHLTKLCRCWWHPGRQRKCSLCGRNKFHFAFVLCPTTRVRSPSMEGIFFSLCCFFWGFFFFVFICSAKEVIKSVCYFNEILTRVQIFRSLDSSATRLFFVLFCFFFFFALSCFLF